MTKLLPDHIDILVGRNIRKRRKAVGLSQVALAAKIGVTYQQIQKYETGKNRISASRFYHIAAALNCRLKDL